ncbi:hypothetical protein, partial [Arthrobacter sp. Hiyo1]|uniref:hypothetical protein n=1 Tax=Arthrobacter sp. Hiyo1 TaxID=1588020 RepID=UPI001C0F348A
MKPYPKVRFAPLGTRVLPDGAACQLGHTVRPTRGNIMYSVLSVFVVVASMAHVGAVAALVICSR